MIGLRPILKVSPPSCRIRGHSVQLQGINMVSSCRSRSIEQIQFFYSADVTERRGGAFTGFHRAVLWAAPSGPPPRLTTAIFSEALYRMSSMHRSSLRRLLCHPDCRCMWRAAQGRWLRHGPRSGSSPWCFGQRATETSDFMFTLAVHPGSPCG